MPINRSLMILGLTLLALGSPGGIATGASDGTNDALITGPVLPATAEGINEFLHSLSPDSDSAADKQGRIDALIVQLGDVDFQTREKAYQQLATLKEAPKATLKRAADSSDLEVRWRAKTLLKQAESRARRFTVEGMVEGVARIVETRKIKGVTESLFKTLDYIDEDRAVAALSEAIIATASETDMPLIEKALGTPKSHARKIAVEAFAAVSDDKGIVTLLAKIAKEDESPDVQLTAAKKLARLGHRPVIAELIRLLHQEDVNIRSQAILFLRGLTRQRFDFVAYGEPTNRLEAIERWTAWSNDEGKSAELTIPLEIGKAFVGKILITEYGNNKVVEVDLDGNELWSATVKHAWDCHGLPNGHRVVSSYSDRRIVEFDADGNEVWEQTDIPGNAMGIDRIENGNTLVACSSANKVVEYSRENEIVWEATIKGRPVDVQRLENGNTLVALEASDADGNQVVEIDTDGQPVWRQKNNSPLTVERLKNSNTLIGSAGTENATELTPRGDVVWEYKVGQKCTAARRLPNGDTVVATLVSLSVVRKDGSVRWKIDGLKQCYGAMPY